MLFVTNTRVFAMNLIRTTIVIVILTVIPTLIATAAATTTTTTTTAGAEAKSSTVMKRKFFDRCYWAPVALVRSPTISESGQPASPAGNTERKAGDAQRYCYLFHFSVTAAFFATSNSRDSALPPWFRTQYQI